MYGTNWVKSADPPSNRTDVAQLGSMQLIYFFASPLSMYEQDGDSVAAESRWSCIPALGPAGSSCTIVYSFGEAFAIEELNIGKRSPLA